MRLTEVRVGQGHVPSECSGGLRQLVPITQSPLFPILCSRFCVYRERRLKLFKTWKLMKYEEIICCEPVRSPALYWTRNCQGTPVGLKPSLAAGLGVCRVELWLLVKSRRWKAGTAGLWTHAFSLVAQIKLPNAVPGEAGGLSRVSKHFLTALSSKASIPFLSLQWHCRCRIAWMSFLNSDCFVCCLN